MDSISSFTVYKQFCSFKVYLWNLCVSPPAVEHLQWLPAWGSRGGLVLSARRPRIVKLFFVLDEHQTGRVSCEHRVFGFVEIQIKGSLEIEANLWGVWPCGRWSHPSLNWPGVCQELQQTDWMRMEGRQKKKTTDVIHHNPKHHI